MKRLLVLPVAALVALLASMAPSSASFCGGSPAWLALTSAAHVQYADPALQQRLSWLEGWGVKRDLALLETKTVGKDQIAALQRLAALARSKLGRASARPFLSVVYQLEGKAWHIMSEHAGSLVAADKAEGISNS